MRQAVGKLKRPWGHTSLLAQGQASRATDCLRIVSLSEIKPHHELSLLCLKEK